jgi:hypothetical protein
MTHKKEKTMQYKIEKGIPIPSTIQKIDKYPFAKMDIDDSFFVECLKKEALRMQRSLHYIRKKIKMDFISRINENGIRIWRIK